jgi:hypothetical protein
MCGYPLQACNETKNKNKSRGDGACANVNKYQRWLSRVDEHVSLITLGLGANRLSLKNILFKGLNFFLYEGVVSCGWSRL